ncbi:hypothetical protein SAMN04488096_10584 [Mesonia phycicola]|uniref:Uncharacterized protein n=1 Tax=Mesonia phycicola TaxID=579105 RepID=A0A1M6EH29_9FLAO|nr:hypothetical protein [Mesonia phycicola]SHI84817.1 hypothetical protein SAMN04488096_10584 [Mesonia phycicola]
MFSYSDGEKVSVDRVETDDVNSKANEILDKNFNIDSVVSKAYYYSPLRLTGNEGTGIDSTYVR